MACEVAAAAAENSIIGVDRFSILPDEIAHKIMSRFSFKDLTRLGCVSKRCKKLQLSAPYISLIVTSHENLGNMLDSFNDFMIQRDDNKIQTFVYLSQFYNCDVESPRLSAWIDSAVRCNVEQLSVGLFPPPDVLFSFPNVLFLRGSLKSLCLNISCVIGGEVSFSPSLSNLESLHLSSVSVIDESFWRWISCSCKRLQNLRLVNIYGSKNIIIKSPSLKKVEVLLHEGDCCNLSICANRLEDISIYWGCTSSNNSVNIFAPKVKFFSWGGIFPSHLKLGEMSFLNEGCISSNGEVTELAIVVDVLCSMRCVKTLQLTDDYVLKV